MTYDSAGNTTTDNITGGGTRTYDADNRMTSAQSGATWNYYVYDADGKRVRRIVNGIETWQVYGFSGELVAEYSVNGATGSPLKEYANGGQTMIVGDATNVRWTVADALGTPRIVADKTGSLSGITRHDYLPFGEELFVGMGNGSIRTTGMGYANGGTNDGIRKKFTGYERDDETGLDYAQARYYSSKQGRFTSPDEFTGGPDELYDFADLASDNPLFYASLIQPQSLNKYQYCYNNPLSMIDPDGHGPETIWDAINVGIGVASFIKNVKDGNYKDAVVDAIGVVVDSAAVAVPIVPGGAGTAIKVYRGGKTIAKTIDRADNAVDTLKAVDKAVDSSKTTNISVVTTKIPKDQRVKPPTKKQRNEVYDKNKEKNEGELVCEICGNKMVPAKKSQKGETPPQNEATIDHIKARSKGGTNDPDNLRGACRHCNRKKSDND